ncbi:MAG: ABC transporter substrate-binding protein [Thermoleophilia bacterium]
MILITALALLAMISVAFGCASSDEPNESITVAHALFESTALLVIADDQNYFAESGLDVSLQSFDTGVAALDAVLAGSVDMAVGTAEFPLVAQAFKGEEIATIGSVAKSDFIKIIARKDVGIGEITDLRGKKIGTTKGTIAEFYLGRYLELDGMTLQDIELVDLKPADYAKELTDGDVDAIASAQPGADVIKNLLGDDAIVWPAQSSQRLYSLIIARKMWIADNNEINEKFLGALAQAEKFAISNPDEAKAIVQRRLDLDPGYMEKVWSQNQFELTLDQSLITAMEDEARWMINNGLTTETTVPDFMSYINEEALKATKPNAVNFFR